LQTERNLGTWKDAQGGLDASKRSAQYEQY